MNLILSFSIDIFNLKYLFGRICEVIKLKFSKLNKLDVLSSVDNVLSSVCGKLLVLERFVTLSGSNNK